MGADSTRKERKDALLTEDLGLLKKTTVCSHVDKKKGCNHHCKYRLSI